MDRRSFLKTAGAAVASLTTLGCAGASRSSKRPSTAGKPNIIFIMADDMGYADLSCYGATKIKTPNMDALAAEGIRFTDAHSPSAVCTPTRYGVLTGRYCWRSRLKTGALGGYSPALIDTRRMTVASLLKQHGYATACIGKWHLGLGNDKRTDYNKPLVPGPNALGFDYFFGIPASLDMTPYCYIENDRVVAKPTLTIDTSDNGSPGRTKIKRDPYSIIEIYGHYPNGNLRGIKADIWDGGHREPFVARWPGKIPAGATSDELVCLTDLIATCAAIVGAELPDDAGEDSCNILPALLARKPRKPAREAIVHHSLSGMYKSQGRSRTNR